MRAADVMQTYPSIDVNAPADDAVRMIGQEHRPAVLVLKDGRPLTVLPGSQVLNFLIPGYLQEDRRWSRCTARRPPTPAPSDCWTGPWETCCPRTAAWSCRRSSGRDDHGVPPRWPACAAPLLVVVNDDGSLAGAISASSLLEHLVP
ncbi:MAG: hypothetical protein R2731_16010 [Nocardioides sp.]